MKKIIYFFKSEEFFDSVKYWLISILIFLFINVDSVFATLGDTITYIGNNSRIYSKNANDSSDGTAIISNTVWGSSYTFSPDGKWIVYVNSSDGYKLYKKSAYDTNNGSAINTLGGFNYFPVFSPDGQWIVYENGDKLYKKSSTDDSNGTIILNNGATNSTPTYSPDGQFIIYSRVSDSNKLYKKSANDTSTGIAITTVTGEYPRYSPDGNYIYYVKDGFYGEIYKKSANDTGNGVSIGSEATYFGFDISPDGLYAIYSKNVSGNKTQIYKKLINSTSTGTIITSQVGMTPKYNGFYFGNCYDGIKNQDETAIDFGGVCGTGNVEYDKFGCINQSFVNPSDITWYSGLYAGTGSLVNPPIFTGSISAYYGTGANHDILMIHDYPFNISAPDDKAFEYGLGRETYFEGGNIRTWSVRGGTDQQFNAVAIYGTGTAGRGVFKHSTDNSNMFTTVGTSFNGSGAVYWIDSTALSNVFDGYYVGTVTGMRLGKTNTFTNKKSCKNASYSCEWKQNGATSFSCIYPYAYDLSDAENNAKCGIDNSGSCVPISGTGFALPGQTTITTASGEVISSSWDPPTSSKIGAIFSCDKNHDGETTWQEYLTCITTVIDNTIEYVQKTQDETTKITSGVILTKTGTQNPFDKGQTTNNNMLSALKSKADTQLVGDTKTSIFVKIFYWFAILLSIVTGLLLFKKEK